MRDDLENIYMLLFRFLGNCFRLALCNVSWLATQESVRRSRARSDRLRAVVRAARPRRALRQLSRHCTRCGVVFFLSHNLSQVHRKGDLSDEVDGMTRKRRRRLHLLPEAFGRCRCAHDVLSCFLCTTFFNSRFASGCCVSLYGNCLTTQGVSSRVFFVFLSTVRCALIRLLLGTLPSHVGIVAALV